MNLNQKIVTNSTPLIELSKINQLKLLREVYQSIYIPEEVYTEVVVNGIGKPGAVEVEEADWILRQPVINKDQVIDLHNRIPIGLGECGAIVLAQEIRTERLIIDDRVARRVAIAKGLPVIGTVGVLRVAKPNVSFQLSNQYLMIFAPMEHESAITFIIKHSLPKENDHIDV